MKNYSITGKTYSGEIQLFFLEKKLARVDFLNCDMKDSQKEFFLKIVAINEDLIEFMMQKMQNCVIVSEDYTISLDEFKKAYPYARNSHLLPPIWDKMSASDKVLAWLKAGDYSRYCKRNEWYKPKIAAKWLKDKEWLNDWNEM